MLVAADDGRHLLSPSCRHRRDDRRLQQGERRQPLGRLAQDLGKPGLGQRRHNRVQPVQPDAAFPASKVDDRGDERERQHPVPSSGHQEVPLGHDGRQSEPRLELRRRARERDRVRLD